ncbi:MAG: hypothetical protein ACK59A_08590 [Cyanobacteriota bacterium]
MRHSGVKLEGQELGNAWTLRCPEVPHTNCVVGDHPAIPAESLRFLRHRGHPEVGQGVGVGTPLAGAAAVAGDHVAVGGGGVDRCGSNSLTVAPWASF